MLAALRVKHAYTSHMVLAGGAFWISLILMLFSILWMYDRRCMREIELTQGPTVIRNGTKAELIQQFLNIYDVDLSRNAHEPTARHPGELAESWMNCRQVHPDNNPDLGSLLHWLSTARIVKCLSNVDGREYLTKKTGQTAKFQFILEGGYKALFKVKRFERDEVVQLSDVRDRHRRERHNAEIASYHLQRVLGLNRVPVAVGRYVNFTRDMLPVADDRIANNVIVRGSDICIKQTGFVPRVSEKKLESLLCAKNGIFEGALIMWLPRDIYTTGVNFWPKKPKPGEEWPNGIFKIDPQHPLFFNNQAKLLDFTDTLLFDYLIQNVDRNAFYYDASFYSSILLLDEGKSFSNPFSDVSDILEGFSLICQVRLSTYTRLRQLSGGVLSVVLRHVLSRDPIAPVLWEPHYSALDRRIIDILNSINNCILRYGVDHVIIDEQILYDYTFNHFTLSYTLLFLRSAIFGF